MTQSPAPLILIVDDDPHVVEGVTLALADAGLRAHGASNAFLARGLLARLSPDLVILDRRLPDADGLELCKEIRADPRRAELPVLFLTSKGSTTERVVGFTVGADDYLPKPFSSEELVARVRALLRRAAPRQPSAELRSGEIVLDLHKRKACEGGRTLDLTPKEYELLQAFLESNGRLLSRRLLLERVWGYDRSLEVDSRVVDSTISHLRHKLGPSGGRIVTVQSQGYRLEDA